MGDGLKIFKEKRHRSSSSIAALPVEGARSERKLDIRASIPEVDDQFSVAEGRCNNLQQKIELVKNLKKKKKPKRRSTRVSDFMEAAENVPVISVHTKPKKKSVQDLRHSAASRTTPVGPAEHRQLDNASYGVLDAEDLAHARWSGRRRGRADGDGEVNELERTGRLGGGEAGSRRSPEPRRAQPPGERGARLEGGKLRREGEKQAKKQGSTQWRQASSVQEAAGGQVKQKAETTRGLQKHPGQRPQHATGTDVNISEERPLVELFNKRTTSPREPPARVRESPVFVEEVSSGPFDDEPPPVLKEKVCGRRGALRSRHYEAATVSSRMKRSEGRVEAVRTDIPFVVSSSTAPSHNLAVNLQQILNSFKVQLPPRGIPLTLAYHLGLGHVPVGGARGAAARVSSETSGELNAIRAGGRVLRVPSRRPRSYGRALAMLRSGDGLLPRYLRTMRPRSMYDLSSRGDEYVTRSFGEGCGSAEVKRQLCEYATMYRQLERLDERLRGRRDPTVEHRRDRLAAELNARESLIRKIVEEYGEGGESAPTTLRASASNAEDTYRHSTYKLNIN